MRGRRPGIIEQKKVTQTGLEQAEVLSAEWAAA